jgi:hypothetical protein
MAQKSGAADATAAVPFVSRGIMLWSLGGICGYVAFGFICDVIGRRLTVILIARAYSAGTIAAGLTLYAVAGASVDSHPSRLLTLACRRKRGKARQVDGTAETQVSARGAVTGAPAPQRGVLGRRRPHECGSFDQDSEEGGPDSTID